MNNVGTLCWFISGFRYTVMIPRTTITIRIAFTTPPIAILFTASFGFSNDFACCTNTATFASWKVPYKKAAYNAFPNGIGLSAITEIVSSIFPAPAMIFGTYTARRPIIIHTDNTEATFLTRSVPKIATTKINTPISNVQSRYGSPVSVLNVAPPVANATAGATHITQRYNTSNRLENTGAYFP